MVPARNWRRTQEACAQRSQRDGGGSRPCRQLSDSDLYLKNNRRSQKGSEREEPGWHEHSETAALDELHVTGGDQSLAGA